MDSQRRGDAADMLADVSRHWGWVLAFGIITLLAGLLTHRPAAPATRHHGPAAGRPRPADSGPHPPGDVAEATNVA